MPTKDELIRENSQLKHEIEQLKKHLNHSENIAGISAEKFVSTCVKGERSIEPHAQFDIRSLSKHRLEVKFSKLGFPYKGSATKRWSWGHPLGSTKQKKYDRLILIGEVDPRYIGNYADPQPKFVIFDIPFSSVKLVMRQNIIQISTNPKARLQSTAEIMFSRYEVSVKELKKRYGIKTR